MSKEKENCGHEDCPVHGKNPLSKETVKRILRDFAVISSSAMSDALQKMNRELSPKGFGKKVTKMIIIDTVRSTADALAAYEGDLPQ